MKLTTKKYLSALVVALSVFFVQNIFAEDEGGAAKINLSLSKRDTVNVVNVTITKTDAEGKTVAVPKTDVKVYVKRAFSLLPVEGDNLTTDENGLASVDFPNDIPGDTAGTLIVIAKVEDNDELGELETSKSVQWGVPVLDNEIVMKRALWASAANAPIPLVIVVCSILAGVWGVIIYILFQLIKIKKLGLYETTNQSPR